MYKEYEMFAVSLELKSLNQRMLSDKKIIIDPVKFKKHFEKNLIELILKFAEEKCNEQISFCSEIKNLDYEIAEKINETKNVLKL